ncbi:carbohydrate-binding protein, putative [Phytophthora infestans T30-4]|uniref:Carbohydrate-binding protein, putative n=1 Tax=Phytophthora infestans (strain T30-4) TaxID=403677 RepID=D0P253_PHYIT|nr:carbohydrate-binding protein, putative [Phytophthora infestans T30-4]EEY55480.1 carbohydrate-binding protein, putative [Phytophthora infestans T30-4]|eukprot:XP_002895625.1 carbohydrate-binding protein, putative [Phytophthora infestans T30-4]
MYDPGVGGNYAALNNEQWESTHNCGRCAEVSCDDPRCSDTTSTQIVYIVDRCPECKQGDLDLSPTVFKALTGSDPSRYTIKWKFVDCPVSGNVQYCTKSGSSSSWLAIQPANFANGVASMKIANQDVTMVDSCFYYLLNGGSNVDMSAVSVELTSVSGETITQTLSLIADNCTEGTSNFGASTTQQSSTPTSQTAPTPTTAAPTPTISTAAPTPTPTTAPPATPAPAPTTATPTTTTATPTSYTFASSSASQSQTQTQQTSYTFTSNSASQSQTQQSEVTAVDESGSGVSILQSSEAGVEKTPSTQQQDDTDDTKQTASSDTKQANTKSAADSSGTSPVVVALIVLAVVGGIALAAIAYVVKKKKLDDKRIDRDEAMIRSFDTFSSPIEINATNIAKI